MKASVIVLSWNGKEYLPACLDAVLSQDYSDFEVIVVDNGSTDGSSELVRERYPEVRLLENDRNLGFAGGNNVGLRAANGDVLVLLNQDTQAEAGWLAALVSAIEAPDVGIVGSKALYPNGTIQHAGGFVCGPRAETGHLGRGDEDDRRDSSEYRDVDFVTGAALAISRPVLSRIGLLDEGFYPAYYEDVDWCYRARAAGYRVLYTPEARLIHLETPKARRENHEHKFALHGGRLRFVFKHWLLSRLRDEFIPAEAAWLGNLGRTVELMSARRAYLGTLLDLDTIAAFRSRSGGVAARRDPLQEARALAALIGELRLVAATIEPRDDSDESESDFAPMDASSDARQNVAQQEAMIPRRQRAFETLRARQGVSIAPHTSDRPVMGPIIGRLRQLWIRHIIRPLFREQVAFNASVGDFLGILMQMDDQLRVGLHHTQVELQRTQQELSRLRKQLQWERTRRADLERDIAENVRELDDVARRLVQRLRRSHDDQGEPW